MIVEPSVPELLKKAAGAKPKIEEEGEKPVTVAAEEIAAGKVKIEE